MSDIGKVPNPINPANDPKKDKSHPLDPSQYGKKFDYRKQDKTASGQNKHPFLHEEEEPPITKNTEKPSPDSIFTSSSSGKPIKSFPANKNADSNNTKKSTEANDTKKSAESSDTKKLSSSAKNPLERQESLRETPEKKQAEEHKKKKEPISANPMLPPSQKLSFHSKKDTHSIKPQEKKKEEILPSEPSLTSPQLSQTTYQPPLLPTGSGFTSYQISQLFDRMVGTITIMNDSGIKTTEFILSGEEFSSSIFYGAHITITEYSTAPKTFNIQLSASPKAVALFQENMSNLLVNFASGNYAFRINRLETSLIEERPLFKRKSSSENDQQPTQGDS